MIKILNEWQMKQRFKKLTSTTVHLTEAGLHVVGQKGVTIVKQNSPTIEGRLRGSFSYSIDGENEGFGDQGNGKTLPEDKMRNNKKKKTVVIGTNCVYAKKVEFLSNTGSRGFMQISFNQLKQIAEKMEAEHIKKGIG